MSEFSPVAGGDAVAFARILANDHVADIVEALNGESREVAAEGIRVNAVRPGIIDTEIHASGGEPDRIAAMREGIPMKREGTAEEVAEVVLWLLSDAASYTTGSIVNVSGGR